MRKIRIFRTEENPFVKARDRPRFPRNNGSSRGTQAEIDATASRVHHPGASNSPQLFEVQIAADTEIQSHAHGHDEIIYVVEGELHVGATVLGPGSSIAVDAYTLYGFRTGPGGARFVNFRPCADDVYLNKADFMARRNQVARS